MTLLLISPVNVDETLIAIRGGADIIDVKNPAEGSLGANFPWVIAELRRVVPPNIPLSAAIGDFPNLPGSAALAASGAVRAGANIVKIGLKGPADVESATYLMKQVVRAAKETSASAKVVACAYGDFRRAKTIDPAAIPKTAHEAGAEVAMLDTAVKDGRPLTDFLGIDELRAFVDESHSHGLWAALAGSLGFEEVRTMKPLSPDVIGVRGAVCEGGDRRTGKISGELVQRLKKLLET